LDKKDVDKLSDSDKFSPSQANSDAQTKPNQTKPNENMKSFNNWKEAHTNAVELANLCKRDVGISKSKEFGKEVFNTFLLPNKENRCGRELTCEIVSPNTPI